MGNTNPRLEIIGAALADQSRARILCEMMDGRAFTNKELACAAEITPQTASAHLKHLTAAGLTRSLRSGRHVYHRIKDESIARALEGLAAITSTDHIARNARTKNNPSVLTARTCYNHIAGRLGVVMTEALRDLNVLEIGAETVALGPKAAPFLDTLCIKPQKGNAPFVRLCLDWTERRHHISGPLATAILQKALTEGWVHRHIGSRHLSISDSGYNALENIFVIPRQRIEEMQS